MFFANPLEVQKLPPSHSSSQLDPLCVSTIRSATKELPVLFAASRSSLKYIDSILGARTSPSASEWKDVGRRSWEPKHPLMVDTKAQKKGNRAHLRRNSDGMGAVNKLVDELKVLENTTEHVIESLQRGHVLADSDSPSSGGTGGTAGTLGSPSAVSPRKGKGSRLWTDAALRRVKKMDSVKEENEQEEKGNDGSSSSDGSSDDMLEVKPVAVEGEVGLGGVTTWDGGSGSGLDLDRPGGSVLSLVPVVVSRDDWIMAVEGITENRLMPVGPESEESPKRHRSPTEVKAKSPLRVRLSFRVRNGVFALLALANGTAVAAEVGTGIVFAQNKDGGNAPSQGSGNGQRAEQEEKRTSSASRGDLPPLSVPFLDFHCLNLAAQVSRCGMT